MSFQAQEQLLFKLLFDRDSRAHFLEDRETVLANDDLSETEKEDFRCIRSDALEIDAKMRIYMLLDHWSKAYPLTFSIVSATDNGLEHLRQLVDYSTLCSSPISRVIHYGERLRNWLQVNNQLPNHDKLLAIQGAELEMARLGATLRQALRDNTLASGAGNDDKALPLNENWHTRPLVYANFTGAVLLPQSYELLNQALCPELAPGKVDNFWARLNHQPPGADDIQRLLAKEDPRLLMLHAVPVTWSGCDPEVTYQTLELSEGFLPLLQHINGQHSLDDLMAELKRLEAPPGMIEGIARGFKQMLELGMLRLD